MSPPEIDFNDWRWVSQARPDRRRIKRSIVFRLTLVRMIMTAWAQSPFSIKLLGRGGTCEHLWNTNTTIKLIFGHWSTLLINISDQHLWSTWPNSPCGRAAGRQCSVTREIGAQWASRTGGGCPLIGCHLSSLLTPLPCIENVCHCVMSLSLSLSLSLSYYLSPYLIVADSCSLYLGWWFVNIKYTRDWQLAQSCVGSYWDLINKDPSPLRPYQGLVWIPLAARSSTEWLEMMVQV